MKTKERADSKEQTIEITEDQQNDCQKQIEKLTSENVELKDQLIRKAAELENFRKRTNREKQELLEYGNERLQMRFLEVADDFENAFDAAEKSNVDSKMLEGFQMIFRKIQKIFSDHNIVEIEEAWDKILTNDASIIGFDCAKLEFIDSSAIGTLVKFFNSSVKNNIEMYIFGLRTELEKIFETTKINRMMSVVSKQEFDERFLK